MGKNAKIMSIAAIVVVASMLSVTLITSDFSSGEGSFTAENGVIYEINESGDCRVTGFDTLIASGDVTIPDKVPYTRENTTIYYPVSGINLSGVVYANITKLVVYVDAKIKQFTISNISIPTLKSFAILSPSSIINTGDVGIMQRLNGCSSITDISIEGLVDYDGTIQRGIINLSYVPQTVERLRLVGVSDNYRLDLRSVCNLANLKELYVSNVVLTGGPSPDGKVNATTFYNCCNLDKVTIGDNVEFLNWNTFCNTEDGKLGATHYIEIGNNVTFEGSGNSFNTKGLTISGFVFKGQVTGPGIDQIFGCDKGAYTFESSGSKGLKNVQDLSGRAFVGNNGVMKETETYTISFETEGGGSLNVDSISIPIFAHATVTVDELNKEKLIVSWGSSSTTVIAASKSDTEFVNWDSIPTEAINKSVTIKAIFTESPGPTPPTPTPPTPTPGGDLSIDPTIAFAVVVAVFIAAMIGLAIIVKKK